MIYDDCGGLCCYVDDSTYMFSSADPTVFTDKLSDQCMRLARCDNRLVINDDRTHLLVMGTPRFVEATKKVRIETGTVTIDPINTEKLLGINIHESLKWKEHILSNDKSLIKLQIISSQKDC